MAYQAIGRGTSANDGTGDDLRSGAGKINANFVEVYTKLGDGSTLTSDTVTLNTATQTLTNKTLTAPTITGAGAIAGVFTGNITGNVTGNADTATALATARTIAGQSFDGTANITIASSDLSDAASVVTETSTDTLTNKTLTAPTIASITNGGTVTIPSGADTLVARTSTDTLTNKTLTSPTITGTGAIAGVFTGNITGNVIGNVTGNVTGNVDGIVGGTTPAAGLFTTASTSVHFQAAVHADTTARDAAIPSPAAGMVAYLTATNKLQVYTGSAWETITSA